MLTALHCQPAAAPEAAMDDTQRIYAEPYRPQFHFSPPAHWMNDPNGMVYLDGEYHLFYQYYPDSTVWGPMHWGHAVSRDLLHWEHLPVALYPDSLGYIFSGSVVTDPDNTSGFGEPGATPLVAIYTYHEPQGAAAGRSDYQSQGLAYSLDRGRTWTKYTGNPVIPNPGDLKDFRDPKVFRYEPTGEWIMTLAVGDHIEIWGSANLREWNKLSAWGHGYGDHSGVWECPDLFPIRVEDSDQRKWVLIQNQNPGSANGGSGTQYFVGDFDGRAFTIDPGFARDVRDGKAVWLDHGRDNYAGVTWYGLPGKDPRRVFLGWMSNWDYGQAVPTDPWRSAMTLPRELRLHRTPAGYRLFQRPATELRSLRGELRIVGDSLVVGPVDITDVVGLSPGALEIELAFRLGGKKDTDFGVELSNTRGETYRVGFDGKANAFYSDRTRAGDHSFSTAFAAGRHTAPRLLSRDTLTMQLFLDVASMELFADRGSVAMTEIFFPSEPFTSIGLYASPDSVQFLGGQAYAIRRIWPEPDSIPQ